MRTELPPTVLSNDDESRSILPPTVARFGRGGLAETNDKGSAPASVSLHSALDRGKKRTTFDDEDGTMAEGASLNNNNKTSDPTKTTTTTTETCTTTTPTPTLLVCGIAGCTYTCQHYSKLKRHQENKHRSHATELGNLTWYACSHCGKRFKQKSSLTRHLIDWRCEKLKGEGSGAGTGGWGKRRKVAQHL